MIASSYRIRDINSSRLYASSMGRHYRNSRISFPIEYDEIFTFSFILS